MLKHLKRLALAGAGAAAVTGLALGSAGAASAAVNPNIRLVANGTAGYYALSDGTRSIGATITPTPAALNIGGVGSGGIGTQMCDPDNSYALQEGLTTNGSVMSVEFGFGTLGGPCVGKGVLPHPRLVNAALTGLNPADTVQVFTRNRTLRVHNVWCSTVTTNPCRRHLIWKGFAQFAAFDASVGFDVYNVNVWTPPFLQFTENGAGIQQDTTGMSACTPVAALPGYNGVTGPAGSGACNLVASFTGVNLDGGGIFSPSGIGLGDTGSFLGLGPAVQVATTGGALHGNAAIVAPNDSLSPPGGFGSSSLNVYAGEVLG